MPPKVVVSSAVGNPAAPAPAAPTLVASALVAPAPALETGRPLVSKAARVRLDLLDHKAETDSEVARVLDK